MASSAPKNRAGSLHRTFWRIFAHQLISTTVPLAPLAGRTTSLPRSANPAEAQPFGLKHRRDGSKQIARHDAMVTAQACGIRGCSAKLGRNGVCFPCSNLTWR